MENADTTMSAAIDPAVIEEVRDALEGGNLVLFAGGGVSAAAGLPTWRQLAEKVVEVMRGRGLGDAAVEEVAELGRSQRTIEALATAEHALGSEVYEEMIERELDDAGREIPPIARALAGLRDRLRAVVTTNINHLLERAFGWEALPRVIDEISFRRGFILKLHGTLHDRSTWTLTRERFHRWLASPAVRRALEGLFSRCPVLFVGFGRGDETFDQLLQDIRNLSGDIPPPRFALVPSGSLLEYRRKNLLGMGFRLLPYDNPDGTHAKALEIVERIASGMRSQVRAAPRSILPPSIPDLDVPPSSSSFAQLASWSLPGFGELDLPAGAVPSSGPLSAPLSGDRRRRTSEPPANPIEVFFSYAQRDRDLRDKLETHLAILKRKGVIRGWHEGEIGAGEEWDKEVRQHLEAAKMILLLVSADFLASDFCYEEQMRRAIQRHDRGEARVIPVIVDACDWEPAPFGKLSPLPENGTPVTSWPNQSEAFAEIAKGIRRQVERLTQNPS
jgi:NAD-dependent SIR2 family protein deacetylase